MEKWHSNKSEYVLGSTNLVRVNDTTYVFQMLAQKGLFPKGNEIPLKYNELRKCLLQLADAAYTFNYIFRSRKQEENQT